MWLAEAALAPLKFCKNFGLYIKEIFVHRLFHQRFIVPKGFNTPSFRMRYVFKNFLIPVCFTNVKNTIIVPV